jgi:hypothetical protein
MKKGNIRFKAASAPVPLYIAKPTACSFVVINEDCVAPVENK